MSIKKRLTTVISVIVFSLVLSMTAFAATGDLGYTVVFNGEKVVFEETEKPITLNNTLMIPAQKISSLMSNTANSDSSKIVLQKDTTTLEMDSEGLNIFLNDVILDNDGSITTVENGVLYISVDFLVDTFSFEKVVNENTKSLHIFDYNTLNEIINTKLNYNTDDKISMVIKAFVNAKEIINPTLEMDPIDMDIYIDMLLNASLKDMFMHLGMDITVKEIVGGEVYDEESMGLLLYFKDGELYMKSKDDAEVLLIDFNQLLAMADTATLDEFITEFSNQLVNFESDPKFKELERKMNLDLMSTMIIENNGKDTVISTGLPITDEYMDMILEIYEVLGISIEDFKMNIPDDAVCKYYIDNKTGDLYRIEMTYKMNMKDTYEEIIMDFDISMDIDQNPNFESVVPAEIKNNATDLFNSLLPLPFALVD